MNKYLENAEVRDFYGYKHYVFDYNGHVANVIVPHEPQKNYWIWRAEFLDCGFDWVDMEMLRRGFALMYYSISDMYGCPDAVELMDGFWCLMTEEFGYAEKTIFFGLTGTGYFDMMSYQKFHDGVMTDYAPTDEEIAKGLASVPKFDI